MPRVGIESDGLKKEVRAWAKKIGVGKARLILVRHGVAYSTADFLCQGRYVSNPKERLIGLLQEAVGKTR